MFGIVGVGAAGGNIADEGMINGIPSIAINYSQKDLDSLVNVEDKLTLVGSEGVGKNRDNAIKLMSNNWELATTFIKNNMTTPSTEIIFIVFSTGGGSGSGISPILIDFLQNEMPDKVFVACPILPDTSEVLINQINSLSTFEQLSNLDICVLPIDNEKIRLTFGSISKNLIYKKTNQSFIKLLLNLISYTEKHSKNGIVDKRDLLQIFNTKGIGIISEVNIGSISNLSLSQNDFTIKIQESWKKSIFSQIEYEQVLRAGIIFDGNESLMEYLRYDLLFDVFANGMPIDLFEGNYHDGSGKVISALTGLPWITTRLNHIESIIENKKLQVDLQMENSYQSKIAVNDFSSQLRKTTTKKKNAMDILSKYQR